MLEISHNKLAMYQTCPRKYKYHFVDELHHQYAKDRPYLSMGDSIHRALNAFYSLADTSKRTLSNMHLLLRKYWKRDGYSSTAEEKDYGNIALDMLTKYYINNDCKKIPYLIEEYFQVPFNTFFLTGKLDRVDREGDDKYTIIYYKTGKTRMQQADADTDLQMSIYALAFLEKFGLLPHSLEFHMLRYGDKIITRRTEKYLNHFSRKIQELVGVISGDGVFKPTPNPYCLYCDYAIICPAVGMKEELQTQTSTPGRQQEMQFEKVLGTVVSLNQSAQSINRLVIDKDKLLEVILEQFLRISGAVKGELMIMNETTGVLSVASMIGLGEEKRKLRLKVGEGVAGMAAQNGEIIISDNPAADPRFKSMGEDEIRPKSLICIPLISKERVLGVVNIEDLPLSEDFLVRTTTFLSILATQSAIAIENANLYELAITDGLTKLYIHRFFKQRLGEEIERSFRYNVPFVLMMMDIDNFKNLNDTYGHRVGDIVLSETAKILKNSLRAVDFVSRYGGEEFAIILPQSTIADALIPSDRIRSNIEEKVFELEDIRARITISIGLSELIPEREKIIRKNINPALIEKYKAKTIDEADEALYKAKREGKNRIVVYDRLWKPGKKDENL